MLIRYILINDNVLQQKGRDMCKAKGRTMKTKNKHKYDFYIGLSLDLLLKSILKRLAQTLEHIL